jgi:transcriptional regulator with XRE-family HTH domain
MDNIEIGKLIRKARKERKITQEELAKRAGLSRATIVSIEKGRIGSLSFASIISVLRIIGYDISVEKFNPFKKVIMDKER